MKKNLKIFWLLSKFSMKTMLDHRVGLIAFLVGKIFRFVVFFTFIYYLVSKTNYLLGYTLNQTIIFFLTFNFIDTLSQILFREVYRFRNLVIFGEFDNILLKPHHPFIRILIGGVDVLDAFLIIPYSLILFYFLIKTNVNFLNIIHYSILIINSLIIATSFHIIVLALGILTTEVDHTIMIYRDITRMTALPVDIYKEPLRFILTFLIPIGIMMTIPVKALFNLLSTQMLILSFFITFIFLEFSLFLWKMALKKYQSVGS